MVECFTIGGFRETGISKSRIPVTITWRHVFSSRDIVQQSDATVEPQALIYRGCILARLLMKALASPMLLFIKYRGMMNFR